METTTGSSAEGEPGAEVAVNSIAPHLLQRFRVLEALGETTEALTYRAEDGESGRRGLLKLVRFPRVERFSGYERMYRELDAQCRLERSPVLALPEAVGRLQNGVWLFRSACDGSQLSVYLAAEGPLAPAAALGVAGQIALGLDRLHRSGLLHRDVSPARVIVGPESNGSLHATLIDAGLAAPMDAEGHPRALGTPAYASPEVISGKLTSFRSDLYSLGCVLYEMLGGIPPFQGGLEQVLYAHTELEAAPLAVELSEDVRRLVQQLLAKDARHRPFSARQVLRVCEPHVPARATSPPPAVSAPPPPPARASVPPPVPRAATVPPGARASVPPPVPRAATVPPRARASAPPPVPRSASVVPARGRSVPPPPPPRANPARVPGQTSSPFPPHRSSSAPPPPASGAYPSVPPPVPSGARSAVDTEELSPDDLLEESEPSSESRPLEWTELEVEEDGAAWDAKEPEADTTEEGLEDSATRPFEARDLAPGRLQGAEKAGAEAADEVGEPAESHSSIPPASDAADNREGAQPREDEDECVTRPLALHDLGLEPEGSDASAKAASDEGASEPENTAADSATRPSELRDIVAGADPSELPEPGSPLAHGPPDASAHPPDAASRQAPETSQVGSESESPRAPAGLPAAKQELAAAPETTSSAAPTRRIAPRGAEFGGQAGTSAPAPQQVGSDPVGQPAADPEQPSMRGDSLSAAQSEDEALSVGTASTQPAPPQTIDPPATPEQNTERSRAPRRAPTPALLAAVASLGLIALFVIGVGGDRSQEEPGLSKGPGPAAPSQPSTESGQPSPPSPTRQVRAASPRAHPSQAATGARGLREQTSATQVASTGSQLAAHSSEQQGAGVHPRPPGAARSGPSDPAANPPLASRQARRVDLSAPQPAAKSEQSVRPATSRGPSPGAHARRERVPGSESTEDAVSLRSQARAHYRARRFKRAADAYRAATEKAPSHAGSYAGLGASELARGRVEAAVKAYQRAVQISPRTSGFHAALGRAYLLGNDRERALQAYTRALELDPGNRVAQQALARLK